MRMLLLLGLVTLFFSSPLSRADSSTVAIEGTIVNHKGRVFADVAVHAFGTIGSGAAEFHTRTDANGKFRFDVPPGEWLIRVDPDELIIRGYACFPDFTAPVFADVKELKFEVIPTRPIFSPPQIVDGEIHHKVTFDTTTVAPIETVRTYEVQWSIDHTEWKTFTSISLLNSPLEFKDPDGSPKLKFYRATLVENEP